MALWHVPGMSIAVVTPDETLFQQSFGETSIEDGVAVDEHTLFAIGSTTKAMVVEAKGKLTLYTPWVTLPMQHWHVDTLLMAHPPWSLREFVSFQLMPESTISSFEFPGDIFRRVE
jgi:hypothetical protein